jgi:murein DD-endopeptidase MepM/ murein hydrolase activator NlpD
MNDMVRACALFLFLVVSWIAVTDGASALTVVVPKSVDLGDAFSISVPGGSNIKRMSVVLARQEGEVVAKARAFPVRVGGGAKAWVALIGVPTTILPGSYRVRTTVSTSRGTLRKSLIISVLARTFHREDIKLDRNLSTLQTEDTLLKEEQAKQLWHILTTFRSTAVYQTRAFSVPVVNYVVTAPFGERRRFVFADGDSQAAIHQGLDMAVAAGTPVKAAGAGRVVFAGSWLMTGRTVVIEHLPGVYSLYFHMERILVETGQMVKQAEPIGLVGSTGLATGPHLHWQIEINGVAVDPMSLVKTGLIALPTIPRNRQTAAGAVTAAGGMIDHGKLLAWPKLSGR